jgi:hypothetical protein
LADKSTQLLLDALSRAAADPAGVPLHASKSSPGLFPTTAAAKAAAQRCKQDHLVKVVRTETRGKAVQEVCALTEKGLAYLLSQVSPRQLLEDLVRAVESRQAQLTDLVATARQSHASLDAVKSLAEKVLQQVGQPGNGPAALPGERAGSAPNGAETCGAAVLAYLGRRQESAEDCPLPELYQAARQAYPKLSVGQFHDVLRQQHEQERVYLHPWTGPLYDLPEPPYALLIGHEILYYASLR